MNNLNITITSKEITNKNVEYLTRHTNSQTFKDKGRLIIIKYTLNNDPNICFLGVSNQYVITELSTGLRVPYNKEFILLEDKTRSRKQKLEYILNDILTDEFTLKILNAYEKVKPTFLFDERKHNNE